MHPTFAKRSGSYAGLANQCMHILAEVVKVVHEKEAATGILLTHQAKETQPTKVYCEGDLRPDASNFCSSQR